VGPCFLEVFGLFSEGMRLEGFYGDSGCVDVDVGAALGFGIGGGAEG